MEDAREQASVVSAVKGMYEDILSRMISIKMGGKGMDRALRVTPTRGLSQEARAGTPNREGIRDCIGRGSYKRGNTG